MRLRDIPECVRIVAAHPILAPRYGNDIGNLRAAWGRLLGDEWFFTNDLFEEVDGTAIRTLGVGISVFVTDEFFREAKTPPFFWLGPELAQRIVQGRSPLLTEKQVGEANSRQGLNLVIWQTGVQPDDAKRPEVWEVGVSAFLDNHRGFRLNEFILQAESAEHLSGITNAGSILYGNSQGTYRNLPERDLRRAAVELHLGGLTREIASKQVGSWVSSLFLYRPPLLRFSRSEQRLLCAARYGDTDEALSNALRISLFAVKKCWRAIYARVADRLPTLLPNPLSDDPSVQDRGREKKRRLVAYLREHPEELRPVSHKLLQKASAKGRPSFASNF